MNFLNERESKINKHMKNKMIFNRNVSQTYPCYVLKGQVILVSKVEFCVGLLDYKHILQSYTEIPILIVTRFWKLQFQCLVIKLAMV